MAPHKPPVSVIKTEVTSPDLDRLENIVTTFTGKVEQMLEEDHKKTALVYDFLFVGQPQADPPVQPFVSQVQASLSSQEKQLNSMKSVASKFIWLVLGVLVGGAGWFVTTTLGHIFAK